MNLLKCSNGHYYDGDAYSSCPHCKGQGAADNPTVALDIPAAGGGEVTVAMPSNDEGPTLSGALNTVRDGFGTVLPSDDQKTVSFFSESPVLAEKDPVVGWMVCVKGNLYGQDFRLKTGRNFIGRGDGMDVCLKGEKTVSRDRHAILIYEPKQNLFLAQPGETKELIYLNGSVVLTPTIMKKNDVLQVGDISLMLIPCCDDVYRWQAEE